MKGGLLGQRAGFLAASVILSLPRDNYGRGGRVANGMRMLSAFLCANLLVTSVPAGAGIADYQCEISEHMLLGKDGTLKRPPIPYLIGERFAVDRNTGQVIGPNSAFWSNPTTTFQVLKQGSKDNFFIVVGVEPGAKGTSHYTFITVEEFAEGLTKPFMVQSGGAITAGTCK